MDIGYKVAEVELAYKPKVKPAVRLATSEDCYNYLLNTYKDSEIEYRESFKVIFLNNSLKVIGWLTASVGGLNETMVDIRIVLQAVLLCNASLIICGHNHPSGSIKPSSPDDKLTERLKKACDVMNIRMLDHLIITPETYYSYNDEGRL